MRGYGGRILFVDVGTGDNRIQPVTEAMARALLGGNGFAARLLLDHVPAGVDAYDPANAVIFAVGPVPTPPCRATAAPAWPASRPSPASSSTPPSAGASRPP